MGTGACGISCDACRLHLLGACSSCGPGNGSEALGKMAAQIRIMGAPCPILDCAVANGVAYCLRDCPRFPCHHFKAGPYPFSEGFLNMQERRLKEAPPSASPTGEKVRVPAHYWEDLSKKDPGKLSMDGQEEGLSPGGIIVPFLGRNILVDVTDRCLKRLRSEQWERIEYPLMELIFLVYLQNVGPEPLDNEMISVNELKESHFFQGPHALRTAPLLERYGRDLSAFTGAAEFLGARKLDLADLSFTVLPFPKVPLHYLLWEGDEEFAPRLSVLFDRSVEKHLPADAIWGTVTLVTDALLRSPNLPF